METAMEYIFTFIVYLIFSLCGGVTLVGGLGIPLDNPSLTVKEKKQGQICNIVIFIIAVFAILGFLFYDKNGQFLIDMILRR
jgi:hypothetical protein